MSLRNANTERLNGGDFDVLIVGGGINGAVSAAVLATRGARVALVDRGDFAAQTSQESSNLVWGGFKYLDNYELLLVRDLCMSRNRLTKSYPTRIQEIGFMAALDQTSPFSPQLATLGATAYWGIGNFRTPRPRYLSRKMIQAEEPVINTDTVRGGIEYYDAYLKDNDARFVFSFVRHALDVGATAANYVEVTSATRQDGRWRVELADAETASTFSCTADLIINAAGPYVDALNTKWGTRTDHRIVYSKGIHLVVPQLTRNERVLAFFDDTQRLFYVIPMGDRSVIGTTDTRVDTPETVVTDEDRDFLLTQINARLNLSEPLTAGDIISERTGVRPLVVANDGDKRENVDWTALSRKHEIEVDKEKRIITIFGGKLTDCLNVGEEIAEAATELGLLLEQDKYDWYGEPDSASRERYDRQVALAGLENQDDERGREPISDRLWRRHGNWAFNILEAIQSDPALGLPITGFNEFLRAEIQLAAQSEMVTRLEDFVRRRTMLSLVNRPGDAAVSEGLYEIAVGLYGDQAELKLREYLGSEAGDDEPVADTADENPSSKWAS